jgi:hypothetical protein
MLCPRRVTLNPGATPAALSVPQLPRPSRAAGSFSGQTETSFPVIRTSRAQQGKCSQPEPCLKEPQGHDGEEG